MQPKITMDSNRLLPLLLGTVGLALVGAGLLRWTSAGALALDSRILLGAGLALVLGVVFAGNRRRREQRREAGFPADDELSLKWKHEAGYIALHLSFFLWMAIFFFQDHFGERETMLGAGLLGSAGLYGLTLLILQKRTARDEDPH